ncbi:hypothetical protein P0M04_23505 [Telluria mixta]|uniref:hypothetical protein n=1 Tax=Telluria mixta TaxID=34071 RepID=UPI00247ACF35|nr:hypothetical protein [Telluria mixta]WEM94438.1 hypothetical protein P0M04_23505 [Telluria mixta]
MQYKRILECLLASGALLMSANTAFAQVAPQPADAAPRTARRPKPRPRPTPTSWS